ncbi:alpha/beta hydrolase [Xenorhabdus szentirmaii]|uniref:alpha/beta hydrolase n=1 Tax=Xenorhabdus szentirmaii TaxID=290112 RepID=UPI002B409429|nr:MULTISPECIES: alpha/beta hydrolase [unclassified Xenorhabdus]
MSGGTTCAAWYLPATTDSLANDSGRPCIVMVSGFGGTRDTGLLALSEAGIDAFVFDYRGFGDYRQPETDLMIRNSRK